MGKMKKIFWTLAISCLILTPGVCLADETDIFSYSMDPDALIILDLSLSMNWNPAGNNCYSAGCTRLDMAKAAIKAILDDNNDGSVNSTDENSLRIRMGYMRFYNCSADDTAGDYSSGCSSLITAIPSTEHPFSSPSRYSDIWSLVNAEVAGGSTALAAVLKEAKLYLDYHKNNDTGGNTCRQKFVILVTDGEDTLSCSANGYDGNPGARRRTVANVKALADAGYKVFVIGFGASMPAELKNTLNWMAFYGGTDNPTEADTGDKTAITFPADLTTYDPCAGGTTNDPANATLTGYAFIATSADALAEGLRRAVDFINNSRISFSVSSVAAYRTTTENFLYEASFQPVNGDPFWLGHLRR